MPRLLSRWTSARVSSDGGCASRGVAGGLKQPVAAAAATEDDARSARSIAAEQAACIYMSDRADRAVTTDRGPYSFTFHGRRKTRCDSGSKGEFCS